MLFSYLEKEPTNVGFTVLKKHQRNMLTRSHIVHVFFDDHTKYNFVSKMHLLGFVCFHSDILYDCNLELLPYDIYFFRANF